MGVSPGEIAARGGKLPIIAFVLCDFLISRCSCVYCGGSLVSYHPGIQLGDRIVSVNSLPVDGLPHQEVSTLIKSATDLVRVPAVLTVYRKIPKNDRRGQNGRVSGPPMNPQLQYVVT